MRSMWLLAAAIIATPALADEIKITLGQVRDMQTALASIETRDGKPVPTCLGDVKAPCIPLSISSVIADDLVARFVAPMENVEWVEVLPFHQMGGFKWRTLGLEYELSRTPTPTDAQVRSALEIFRSAGCQAR